MAKNEIPKISDFPSLGLCYGFANVHCQEVSPAASQPGAMGTVSTQAFCSLEIVDGFKSESLVEKQSEGGNLEF